MFRSLTILAVLFAVLSAWVSPCLSQAASLSLSGKTALTRPSDTAPSAPSAPDSPAEEAPTDYSDSEDLADGQASDFSDVAWHTRPSDIEFSLTLLGKVPHQHFPYSCFYPSLLERPPRA